MTMRFFDVTAISPGGAERTLRVPSPTEVQAGDAAASLLRSDEAITAIVEAADDGLQQADGWPPKTQAEELASVTPGLAAPR